MKSQYKISIPKPCHQDWSKMTPKEKGKFCSSCSKTVVDFTQKSTMEIQEFLIENKNQRICGHFNRKQLTSIVIEIPKTEFQQQLSFQRLFILALFFVMGTTLFSCQFNEGKKQKIEDVILIDTIKKVEKELDSLSLIKQKDSAIKSTIRKIPPPPQILGITIIETTGEVELSETIEIDDIIEIKENEEIDFLTTKK